MVEKWISQAIGSSEYQQETIPASRRKLRPRPFYFYPLILFIHYLSPNILHIPIAS